jgi:hypothetical protein
MIKTRWFQRGSLNSAHIRGTHVPVEEPSTASRVSPKNGGIELVCNCGMHPTSMRAAAMPIRFLLEEDHAFSPDDVKILVDAFEGTLRALGLTDPEDPSSIKVAKIIVGLAKDGERDPARLRDLALKFVRPS